MLDHDHRVAAVHQLLEHGEQRLHVGERKAGRRLVEDVDGAAGRAPREFGRKLHPLRLAAGDRGRGLPEADIPEAHLLQRLQLAPRRRERLEQLQRLGHRHVQHLGDVLATEADLQRFAVVAGAVADLAGHGHVGEELHLDLDVSGARAGLAAAALHVEREAARLVAARPRLRDRGEEFAHRGEQPGVGRGVRARRAADRRLVDHHGLVDVFEALDPGVRAGALARAVQFVCQRLRQDLVQQRRLPGAGDAGDADEQSEWEMDVDLLQVVRGGAAHNQRAAVAGPAAVGHRDLPLAGQVLAGDRGRCAGHLVGRAGRHHLAAVLAGAGAEVDQVVGGAHHRLVVLDHEHGIAEVAQPQERADEPLIVDRVQADRGLVADVEHAHERRADLRGEADALPLAAGERLRGAIEREVAEPDIQQEAQPPADLLQNLACDPPVARGQRRVLAAQALRPRQGVGDRQPRHVHDRLAVDRDGEHLRLQPRAPAVGARDGVHVAFDVVAHPVGLGLAVAAGEVGEHAFPGDPVLTPAAVTGFVLHVDLLAVGPVHERVPLTLVEVLERGVEGETHRLAKRAQAALVPARSGPPALPERQDAAVVDAQLLVGDHELLVELHLHAEPGARRTGAVRAVEREVARLDLAHGVRRVLRIRAGEVLGERLVLPPLRREHHHARTEFERLLHRIGDALPRRVRLVVAGGGHDDAVDDDVDVVPLVAGEIDLLLEIAYLAVDAEAHEAGPTHLLDHVLVLSALVLDQWREQHRARAALFREHRVDDLLHRLASDHLSAVRAVRHAGARE